MPAKSRKQWRFMEAVAHNKAFAKKVGVPQSVGKEFAKYPEPTKSSKAKNTKKCRIIKGKKVCKK